MYEVDWAGRLQQCLIKRVHCRSHVAASLIVMLMTTFATATELDKLSMCDAWALLSFWKSGYATRVAQPWPDAILHTPVVIVSDALEDRLEECYDMKCPITHLLLVEPVMLQGKVRA